MKTQSVLLLGVFLCVACVVLMASAGKGKHKGKKGMMAKCGEEKINTTAAWYGFKECKPAKTEKASESEGEERRRRSPEEGGEGHHGKKGWGKWKKDMCIAVCAWKKQGVLDADGKFSESGAAAHANAVYPESFRANATAEIKACADEHASKFSMEEKCKGYKEFKHCAFKAHMKTCGIKWDGKWGKGKGKKDKSQDPPASANEDGGDEE